MDGETEFVVDGERGALEELSEGAVEVADVMIEDEVWTLLELKVEVKLSGEMKKASVRDGRAEKEGVGLKGE